MPFISFDLERWQSTWEKRVRYNLSESGVHGLSIGEVLALSGGSLEELTGLAMGYGQSDGTPELRARIAALYPGVDPEQITVTIGSSEANFVACWTLLAPRDRVAALTPMYMQIHGLARNLGAEVVGFPLHAALGWEPDPDEIVAAIRPGTKLVVVTDPNNPTGHVLSRESREAILTRAREVGAWLLVDEVYQGAELDGRTTPTWWGAYDKTVIVNGLSKAYGLPGLRVGWIVAPPGLKARMMRRHDYTVIGPSPAVDYLAGQALAARDAILARTRHILNTNFPILDDWLRGFGDVVKYRRPECGAICLVRYQAEVSSLDLVERIRAEQDVLLVPGEHFLLERCLRLGFGNAQEELAEALEILGPAFRAAWGRGSG